MALCNDMACSAAMLLAAACTRLLVTQTAKIGSIGVMMAHTSYEKQLAQGVDITLIYSGQHKVDGNRRRCRQVCVRIFSAVLMRPAGCLSTRWHFIRG
ncbi:S49 family peptidase [Escherichia coli]